MDKIYGDNIYIPIWLDLLWQIISVIYKVIKHLHSNMVRFIIGRNNITSGTSREFTFQYGQIYYVDYILYVGMSVYHLHSNMVRFIILLLSRTRTYLYRFTFQYGQIYYLGQNSFQVQLYRIYIPIWLDLLFAFPLVLSLALSLFTFQYGQIYYKRGFSSKGFVSFIYIPIWLDLLYFYCL